MIEPESVKGNEEMFSKEKAIAHFREQLASFLKQEYAPAAIEELKRQFWALSPDKPIKLLSYQDRFRYYKDGIRIDYDTVNFIWAQCLGRAAMLALIEPEEPFYLRVLEDYIWFECDQYSWTPPEHTNGTIKKDMTEIDLFESELAADLSEICALLEDRLPPIILERVRLEIERRVIKPYEERTFWWEKARINWTAVCADNLTRCFLFYDPQVLEKFWPRLRHTMEDSMMGFTPDGITYEGLSYWQYGFGHYVRFADLVLTATDGEMDMFAVPRVKEAALYPQKAYLCPGKAVAAYFSDCPQGTTVSRWLQTMLHRRFPDDVPVLGFGKDDDRLIFKPEDRFALLKNSLFFRDPVTEPVRPLISDYSEAANQVFIKKPMYAFAAKGGCNDESHNHNDVGSFVIADRDDQVFCEIGRGRYTAMYFDKQYRYKILNNSSRGHNLPVINGEEQSVGREFRGKLTAAGDTVEIDIAGAYDTAIGSFRRHFDLREDGLTLTDRFEGVQSVAERFVFSEEPMLTDDGFTVGSATAILRNVTAVRVEKATLEAPGKDSCATFYFVEADVAVGAGEFVMDVTIK